MGASTADKDQADSPLQRAAQSLFPAGATLAICQIGTAPPVWPSEEAAIARAAPRRRQEFEAGRAAMRAALARLGRAPIALPAQPDRSPLWPRGLIGSISHTDDVAMAVVLAEGPYLALGLDLEPDLPFPQELLAHTTLPSERDWLAAQSQPLRMARLMFTAKEAAYKCQYPASRTLLDFQALKIEIDLSTNGLTATFTGSTPPFKRGAQLSGRFVFAQGLVVSGFSLAAQDV